MADDTMSNRKKIVDKMLRDYRASEIRSQNENEIRADIRANIEKLGEDPEAFQRAIRMGLSMTPGERQDFTGSLTFFLGVIDGQEEDLFGKDEIDKRNARAQKRADKAAGKPTTREQQDAKSDANPKSNPKRGGAGKGKAANANAVPPPSEERPPFQPDGTPWPEDAPIMITDPVTGATRPETGDELIARVAKEKNAEREQREGGKILANAGKGLVDNGGENPKPKSQTELSKEKLAAAGLH